MNIALALSHDNKAMLVYDQPFEFIPAWIESAADGRGVRIISEEGEEYTAGLPDNTLLQKISTLENVLLVRMENRKPVECFEVSFVNQNYSGEE